MLKDNQFIIIITDTAENKEKYSICRLERDLNWHFEFLHRRSTHWAIESTGIGIESYQVYKIFSLRFNTGLGRRLEIKSLSEPSSEIWKTNPTLILLYREQRKKRCWVDVKQVSHTLDDIVFNRIETNLNWIILTTNLVNSIAHRVD